jgi:hypothetical protein
MCFKRGNSTVTYVTMRRGPGLLVLPVVASPLKIHLSSAGRFPMQGFFKLSGDRRSLKSPGRISRFVASWPWSSRLVCSSGRTVAPSSEMPAKSPHERKYERSRRQLCIRLSDRVAPPAVFISYGVKCRFDGYGTFLSNRTRSILMIRRA